MWPELFSQVHAPQWHGVQSLMAMLYDHPTTDADATQNNLATQAMIHAMLNRYQSSPFADSLVQAVGVHPNVSVEPHAGMNLIQRYITQPLSGYPVGMESSASAQGANIRLNPKYLSDPFYSDETFSHEMGHVLATAQPDVYKGWQTATRDMKAPAGSYAATNSQEGFAEAFQHAIMGFRQAESHDYPEGTVQPALARAEKATPGITYILHYLMSRAPYDRSELTRILNK